MCLFGFFLNQFFSKSTFASLLCLLVKPSLSVHAHAGGLVGVAELCVTPWVTWRLPWGVLCPALPTSELVQSQVLV